MSEYEWLTPILFVLIIACVAAWRMYLDAKYRGDDE